MMDSLAFVTILFLSSPIKIETFHDGLEQHGSFLKNEETNHVHTVHAEVGPWALIYS